MHLRKGKLIAHFKKKAILKQQWNDKGLKCLNYLALLFQLFFSESCLLSNNLWYSKEYKKTFIQLGKK